MSGAGSDNYSVLIGYRIPGTKRKSVTERNTQGIISATRIAEDAYRYGLYDGEYKVEASTVLYTTIERIR